MAKYNTLEYNIPASLLNILEVSVINVLISSYK
nr:MAG TPA: hypothetical protein [Caudoviricetes sp.]